MVIKEKELLELIKTGEKLVLKVFTDNCPHCVIYAPIFSGLAMMTPEINFKSLNLHDLPKGGSKFKRLYMMLADKEKADMPATMLFDKGEMISRKWGRMDEAALRAFIDAGAAPDPVPDYKPELINLFAQKGEIVHNCQKHQKQIDAWSSRLSEIDKRIIELEQILGAPNAN